MSFAGQIPTYDQYCDCCGRPAYQLAKLRHTDCLTCSKLAKFAARFGILELCDSCMRKVAKEHRRLEKEHADRAGRVLSELMRDIQKKAEGT